MAGISQESQESRAPWPAYPGDPGRAVRHAACAPVIYVGASAKSLEGTADHVARD